MKFPRLSLPILLAGLLIIPSPTFAEENEQPAKPSPTPAKERVEFNRDIRPILSGTCFECHGPDKAHRKADLRLDQKESVFQDRGGYVAVAPHSLEDSKLWQMVSQSKMPPKKSGKSLSQKEIDLIRRWIQQGADWQDHWAFVTPKKPPVPEVQQKDWPTTPVDNFILSRLKKENLSHSPPADRYTLIRRVTLELTGLPPTPEEVQNFVNDKSPNAYEKVVDRLLQSPHYGEHMARYWLDAARYGDTHGLHLDNYREMWPYRDWVVRAFNNNKPYDQFVIEQLAGDLLPNPTQDQLVASGFNRCHVTTNEGGSIAKEVYVRNVTDRVETTSTVFMGLTAGCAVCHDHKYDPLTMRDFYSMFAFFNSLDGNPMDGNKAAHKPVIKVPTELQEKQLKQYQKKIAQLNQKLAQPLPQVDQAQADWEKKLRADLKQTAETAVSTGPWHSIGPFIARDSGRAFGRNFGPEGKNVDLKKTYNNNDGEKVKWKARPGWKDGQPQHVLNGEYAANYLFRTLKTSQPRKVTLRLGSDDGIKVWLNGKELLAKNPSRALKPNQEKLTVDLKKGENQLLLKIVNHTGASGFYFAMETAKPSIPENVLKIVKVAPEKRTDEQKSTLRDYYRSNVSQNESIQSWKKQLADLQKQRNQLQNSIPTTLVFKERKNPKPAYILKRGEYDQEGQKVSRATPEFLPPMPEGAPQNRLGFAKWLVDDSHPLTSRVAVNRFWQQIFGTGIVKTSEDFGTQGKMPSHPKLLDFLAVDFRQHNWDVKRIMKMLVMSSAYRQSSAVTPELYKKDPQNRLLARGPRFRLDAEMLRDQALFVSGLLVEKMGGPSVKPPQPDGLWKAVGYSGSNTVNFKADTGSKIYRRSVYTFWKRTSPPPQMAIFDAPSREECRVRRERTNTPMQALLLMNEPQYFEAARSLAERTLHETSTGDPAEIAQQMFFRVTSRPPTEKDLADMTELYREQLKTFQSDPQAAKKLINVGKSQPDENLDQAELAAWTMVGNLILNLDEVVTKG